VSLVAGRATGGNPNNRGIFRDEASKLPRSAVLLKHMLRQINSTALQKSSDLCFTQVMARAQTDAGRELGPGLRAVRADLGVSLREMERRSSLNSGYLSQLEQGKIAHPSPAVLRKVADAYGLRYEEVVAWAGYAPTDAEPVSQNRAVALRALESLGEPTKEELAALTAVVNLLKQQRASS
jgi:HTH-type transcriptional regulator, competence development regulator